VLGTVLLRMFTNDIERAEVIPFPDDMSLFRAGKAKMRTCRSFLWY